MESKHGYGHQICLGSEDTLKIAAIAPETELGNKQFHVKIVENHPMVLMYDSLHQFYLMKVKEANAFQALARKGILKRLRWAIRPK